MNGDKKVADSCPIIDEFIGQGVRAGGASSQAVATATAGCTIITEFVGQGAATGGRQAPEHQALLLEQIVLEAGKQVRIGEFRLTLKGALPLPEPPSSASEGCATITVFTDQGFIPSSEDNKQAGEEGAQKSPRPGVV